MSIIYKELVAAQTLTATASSYYTAPGATQAAIHACTVRNPTGAPVTVSIYRGNAGVPSAANIIGERVIPAGSTVTVHEVINHKLAPGSQIYALGLACTLNISGVEYIPAT